MIVCSYEDRAEALVGLKILVLGLARHCPGVEVHAFAPAAGDSFREWAARQSWLRLLAGWPAGPGGWSAKPAVLIDTLDAGFDEVVWLDSDIVLARDFRPAWGTLAADTCVVAVESPRRSGGDSSETRTEAFGLAVGRVFPRAINSAALRFTPAHRPLLERWRDLLAHPVYREAQTRPIADRPAHLTGDQDVLAALLGSKLFAGVPVRTLAPPHDILHTGWGVYDSYPIRDRLVHVACGLPLLVHAVGQPKP
jgi:hypothetical protein